MNQIPTAFPWTHDNVTCTGMTLRDYFAAKAMNQIIKQAYVLEKDCDEEDDFSFTATMFPLAKEAYAWADAMLKAREA
jgi:hypothetical protein